MTSPLFLRDVIALDLPIFFEHQQEPAANAMAAFPARHRQGFDAHWHKILHNPNGLIKTIVAEDKVAGYVLGYLMDGNREVGYWLGQEFWGRGIATQALGEFLKLEARRPLYAHVVKQNPASLRVLQKNGFEISGEDTITEQHGTVIHEYVLTLKPTEIVTG